MLVAFVVLELVVRQGLGDAEVLSGIARLVLVLAIVIATVALLANRWRDDRPNERFPGIVQDVAVIALFMAIATVIMRETLLATSAVGAVVVGFALQDTLGNLFAGLAIQIEKPFRVGHWIQVSGRDGLVQEITWRATKLRTKDGEFLIVPNSVMAKEPVLNYSEPTIANRVSVEVGASYLTPPNEVKRAIHEAMSNSSQVMASPEPQVVVKNFGGSSIDYLALFWIADYGRAREAQDEVRTNLWYTFRRRNIEIPWPIQIQYERQEAPVRGDADVVRAGELLGAVDLFAVLTPESRQGLAAASQEHVFAGGEAVVRHNAPGDSMFVVLDGRVRVTLEPSGQQVAEIGPGGFFGEMSLLTGEPRTATVRAIDDARVLEIGAAAFKGLAAADPRLIEHVTTVVAGRQVGLEEARAAAATQAPQAVRNTLLDRMRKYLRV